MNKTIHAILMAAALPVLGTDISPGLSIGTGANQIQDGQRLTSAKLLQLVSDATIQTSFYSSKVGQSNLTSSDTILVVSGASGTFHKLTGNQALLQNYQLITGQSVYSTLSGYGTFLIYDPTNNVFGQINLSNLIMSGSQFVNPSNFVMMNLGTNTLAVVGVNPNPWNTNNQAYFMMWTSNSVRPLAISFSNLLNSSAGYIGTNTEPKYVFAQMFTPSTFYYTNYLTNIWGFTNIVPITNLYFGTNTLLFTNNTTVQALTSTDTLPIVSTKQGNTNTTVTLEALKQWLDTNSAPTSYTATHTNGLSTTTVNFPHGLGVIPSQVRAVLACVTNDSPFLAGDEVDMMGLVRSSFNVGNYSVTANSTNIAVRSYTASPSIPTGSGTDMNPTALNWRIKVYARP